MHGTLDYLMHVHSAGDWSALVQIYGSGAAFLILVVLLFLHGSARRIAARARDRAANLSRQVSDLQGSLERLESSITSEVESSMGKRLDSRLDALEDRMQNLHTRQSEALEDRASDLAKRISETDAELRALRRHLDKMEKRMPGVFDRLEDFQRALAKGYESELTSVFESFDNAVSALLGQMRTELRNGLSRIDGIEGMMRTRQRAEQDFTPPREEDVLTGEVSELPRGIAPEPGEPDDTQVEEEAEEWLSEGEEAREQEDIEEVPVSPPEQEAPEQEPEEDMGFSADFEPAGQETGELDEGTPDEEPQEEHPPAPPADEQP